MATSSKDKEHPPRRFPAHHRKPHHSVSARRGGGALGDDSTPAASSTHRRPLRNQEVNTMSAQTPEPIIEPRDIPAGRDRSLDRLDLLLGRWQTRASFAAGFFGPDAPAVTERGGVSFEWLEGRHFLIQRFTNDHPAAPDGIAVIGADGDTGFVQHYYDSRGVTRIYHMSLDNNVWKLWRLAPGFSQRYTGTFTDDGTRITGAWEQSADGTTWEHDFELDYIKLT
jgi:hypothetical protein